MGAEKDSPFAMGLSDNADETINCQERKKKFVEDGAKPMMRGEKKE